MDEELKEWLGLTPQDFMAYASLLAVVGMYINPGVAMDLLLASLALGASVVSCLWGMRENSRFRDVTNWIKRVSYPVCLVAVVVCIYLNFQFWNAR